MHACMVVEVVVVVVVSGADSRPSRCPKSHVGLTVVGRIFEAFIGEAKALMQRGKPTAGLRR